MGGGPLGEMLSNVFKAVLRAHGGGIDENDVQSVLHRSAFQVYDGTFGRRAPVAVVLSGKIIGFLITPLPRSPHRIMQSNAPLGGAIGRLLASDGSVEPTDLSRRRGSLSTARSRPEILKVC